MDFKEKYFFRRLFKNSYYLCVSKLPTTFLSKVRRNGKIVMALCYKFLKVEIVTKFPSSTRTSLKAAIMRAFPCLCYGSICHNLNFGQWIARCYCLPCMILVISIVNMYGVCLLSELYFLTPVT